MAAANCKIQDHAFTMNICRHTHGELSPRHFAPMLPASMPRKILRRSLIFICLCVSACSEPSPAVYSIETLGKADRIAKVTQLLKTTQRTTSPSPIEDAQLAQFRIGDEDTALTIGPRDYETYLYVKLPVDQIDAWLRIFSRLDGPPLYTAPIKAYPPRMSRSDFSSLEFYDADALLPGRHGWIAVSRQHGELFLFTHTM